MFSVSTVRLLCECLSQLCVRIYVKVIERGQGTGMNIERALKNMHRRGQGTGMRIERALEELGDGGRTTMKLDPTEGGTCNSHEGKYPSQRYKYHDDFLWLRKSS